jgi:hypothetical protein
VITSCFRLSYAFALEPCTIPWMYREIVLIS